MDGIITDLTYQKKDKNLINVFIDGEFTFSAPVLKASRLVIGKRLDSIEIQNYKKESNYRVAYNQAIRYLSKSPKSKLEISRYLKQKGHPRELILEIIQTLEEKKYVNDEEYARLFVENRERFRPRSKFALSVELRQKGVAQEIIEEATGGLNEIMSAWNSVEKKIQRWKDLTPDKYKQKLMGFLNRRGFNYEISIATYEKSLEFLNEIENLTDIKDSIS